MLLYLLVLLLGTLQLRSKCAKILGYTFLAVGVQKCLAIEPTSVSQASVTENSFREVGNLVVSPSLMEITFTWKFSDDRTHMTQLMDGLANFQLSLSKTIQENITLQALNLEVEEVIEDIKDQLVTFGQLTRELAVVNTTNERRSRRSALALLGEILLGVQNESQRRQLNKLAQVSADITKNLDLDEKAISKMQVFLNNLALETNSLILASARIGQMAFMAKRMLHHFSAKLDFLRGLLKGQISFEKLEVEQYAQLVHSTLKEVQKLDLRWIEQTLVDRPFTFVVEQTHIKVTFFITTQSLHIPIMKYFVPFKGILRYKNMNYWIESGNHAAVAFDQTNQWSVSLTEEMMLECERWRHILICPHLNHMSMEITSCLEARFSRNISLILHFCSFHHIHNTVSWILNNSLLKHYGSGEPGMVRETCTNNTKIYSGHTITMDTNCFYDTEEARLFPSTIHYYNIVLEKDFATDLDMHKLTSQAQHKLLTLDIGHVTKHEEKYFSSLNSFKWTIVPILVVFAVLVLAFVVWVSNMLATHRKLLMNLCAASIEPEEFFGKELLSKVVASRAETEPENEQQQQQNETKDPTDSSSHGGESRLANVFQKWYALLKIKPRITAEQTTPDVSPKNDKPVAQDENESAAPLVPLSKKVSLSVDRIDTLPE